MSKIKFDSSSPLQSLAVNAIRTNPMRYVAKYSADPRAFITWLEENWHIWHAFHATAQNLVNRVSHWGSRSIIEVMRYESAIRDNTEPFKINNNCTAYLARLFNDVTGSGLFEERECKQDVYKLHGDPR